MEAEPRNWYVRDKWSRVAHHLDHAVELQDRALCGHLFSDILWHGPEWPRAICRACQDEISRPDNFWWRSEAKRLEAEVNDNSTCELTLNHGWARSKARFDI
jgi:hypothetical protein